MFSNHVNDQLVKPMLIWCILHWLL